MTRRNVYMNNETAELVEAFMLENQIETHTEAVRKIIADHHAEKLKKKTDLEIKLNTIDKNVSIITNLATFIAEGMKVGSIDKNMSPLYQEALDLREKEIRRNSSESGLTYYE